MNTIVANRQVEKRTIQQGTKEEPEDIWRWDYASLEGDYGGSKKLIAPGLACFLRTKTLPEESIFCSVILA